MRIQYWITAALAAAVITTVSAAPAGAAPAGAAPAGAAPAGVAGSVSGGSTDEAAFLAIVTPEQPAAVQASFTVPTVRCTSSPSVMDATVHVFALPGGSNGTAGPGGRLAGPGPARAPGLITVAASVVATCSGGSASYQAQALGVPLAMTVSPGDKVLLSGSFDGTTSPQRQAAAVDDITTGTAMSRTRTDKAGFQPVSAFAGVQRAGRMQVADFGAVHWSGVRVNGAPIGSAVELFGFNLIRSIAHPRVLIRTSMLPPSGESFTNTWVAAS